MSQENQSIPLREQVADFLQKYRILLIVLFGGILIAILGIGIYSEVYNGVYDDQDRNLLRLEQFLGEKSQEIDDTDEADLETLLVEIKDEIILRTEAIGIGQLKQRAFIYAGELFFAKEQYEYAKDFYALAYETLDSGLYAAPALFNLAITEEKAGNYEKSIELLTQWFADFSGQSQLAAEALFTIAALQEQIGDTLLATETYNNLINDYPSSNWTNAARSRILGIE